MPLSGGGSGSAVVVVVVVGWGTIVLYDGMVVCRQCDEMPPRVLCHTMKSHERLNS